MKDCIKILFYVFLITGICFAEEVTTQKNPYPEPSVIIYDPKDGQPDQVPEGHQGAATYEVVPGYECGVKWDAEKNAWVFNGAKITIDAVAKTYIPKDEPDDGLLRKHEDGHHDLNKWEYDRKVGDKMKSAIETAVKNWSNDSPHSEEGSEAAYQALDAVINAALDRAVSAIKQQLDIVNEKYDRLTDHGRNDTAASDAVSEVKKEFTRPKNNTPIKPTDLSGGVGDPPIASFDFSTGALSFSGDLLMDHAFDSLDPAIGLVEFQIDPMIWIGQNEDGITWLSDTSIRLMDSLTGEILLNGYLLEVSYMESSLDGFSSMIQAYLDIPPIEAGGLDNYIHSPFLEELFFASKDPLKETMFWFFADQPLFNADGHPLGGQTTGAIKLSVVPIPSPGAVLLAGIGTTLVGWLRRRRAI